MSGWEYTVVQHHGQLKAEGHRHGLELRSLSIYFCPVLWKALFDYRHATPLLGLNLLPPTMQGLDVSPCNEY